MLRAVSYARVSTDGQEDGSSIESQHQANREFAARRDLEIVSEYSDIASGTLYEERVGIQNVLEAIKNKYAATVIVYATDRAGRTEAVQERFTREVYAFGGKLAVSSSGQVFDDYESAEMQLFWPNKVAAWEHKQIINRTNRGKLEHLKYGSYMTRPPLGYRIEKVAIPEAKIKVNRLFIDEETGPIAKEIFRLLLSGIPQTEVLRTVNQRFDKAYTSKLIRIMVLGKDLYAGKPVTRHMTVNGKRHNFQVQAPALISEATHKAIDQIRFKPKKQAPEKPLAGLVKCAHCGGNAMGKLIESRWLTYYCLSKNRERVNRSQGRDYTRSECRKHISAKKLEAAARAFVTDESFPGGLRELRKKQLAEKVQLENRLNKLSTLTEEKVKEIAEAKAKLLALDLSNLAAVAGAFNEQISGLEDEREALVTEANEIQKTLSEQVEIPMIFDAKKTGFQYDFSVEETNQRLRELGVVIFGNFKTGSIEVRLGR